MFENLEKLGLHHQDALDLIKAANLNCYICKAVLNDFVEKSNECID